MDFPLSSQVNVTDLCAALCSELGQEVHITVRQPGQVDSSGNPVPGMVIVLDSAGNSLFLSADQQSLVTQAITAAQNAPAPPAPPTAQEKMTAALANVTDVPSLVAALIAWAGK